MTDRPPPLAAIRFGDGDAIDALLESVVRELQADGVRVGGFVQRDEHEGPDRCSNMYLEDVVSGARHMISQPLGRDAKGCRLDSRALAGLCGLLEAMLEQGIELLALNRFGKDEAEGHGFRTVIESAVVDGIPVLVAVRDSYLPDWQAFVGEWGASLPPVREGVIAWARAVLERSEAAPRPGSGADMERA